jgi:hypothetical protein
MTHEIGRYFRLKGLQSIAICLIFAFSKAVASVEMKTTLGQDGAIVSYHCVDKNSESTVPCPDYLDVEADPTKYAYRFFEHGDFVELDRHYLRLRTGKDKFKDGSWKLSQLEQGLEDYFNRQRNWDEDLKKLKQWQRERPDSDFAKLAEVIYWCGYASLVEHGLKNSRESSSARAVLNQRLEKAADALGRATTQAGNNPSWYALSIRVKNRLGVSKTELKAIFSEGKKRFPEHLGIYHSMAEALEPRWGGSATAFDKFAVEVLTQTENFERGAIYARLYSTERARSNISHLPGKNIADFKLLLASYRELHALYPNSHKVMNYYAHVACKAGEAITYESIRKKLGLYILKNVFTNPSVEVCDRKFDKQIRVSLNF